MLTAPNRSYISHIPCRLPPVKSAHAAGLTDDASAPVGGVTDDTAYVDQQLVELRRVYRDIRGHRHQHSNRNVTHMPFFRYSTDIGVYGHIVVYVCMCMSIMGRG